MLSRMTAAALLAVGAVSAQTEVYTPAGSMAIFSAEKFFVGGDFIYPKWTTPRTINVTLMGNVASNKGDLFIVNPRTATQRRLFRNTDAPTSIDVTSMFTPGDRVVFMYVAVEGSADDKLPKYTGPNQDASSPYYSQASSATHINPALRFGHRWFVAGKSKTFPLEIEFGFEDFVEDGIPDPAWATDMDFDDIVFRVTGLQMRMVTKRDLIW